MRIFIQTLSALLVGGGMIFLPLLVAGVLATFLSFPFSLLTCFIMLWSNNKNYHKNKICLASFVAKYQIQILQTAKIR